MAIHETMDWAPPQENRRKPTCTLKPRPVRLFVSSAPSSLATALALLLGFRSPVHLSSASLPSELLLLLPLMLLLPAAPLLACNAPCVPAFHVMATHDKGMGHHPKGANTIKRARFNLALFVALSSTLPHSYLSPCVYVGCQMANVLATRLPAIVSPGTDATTATADRGHPFACKGHMRV